MLQSLREAEWKWKEIGMDLIMRLPRIQARYDSIWVIVDHLTKVAHFILIKTTYNRLKHAYLYISRVICLHGMSMKIVSD
jgi:hypothetical protein